MISNWWSTGFPLIRIRTRLGQSVQQSLKLGKDLMFVAPETSAGSNPAPTLYSKQLMCEDTGISYEEPSPNSFSFNSPYGACPACKGLGTMFFINMDAVIPDWSLASVKGESIHWEKKGMLLTFGQVQELAKKNKISLKTPIKDLPKKSLNILLYGNEEGRKLNWRQKRSGQIFKFDPYAPFEGIVNMLKRWFNNGHSEGLRDWAESYMHLKPCDTCKGHD